MTEHFKNGIGFEAQPIQIDLPEGIKFDDLHVNQQRLIVAMAQQEVIEGIQGEKIALMCMRKVSLYDSYEDAVKVQNEMTYIDSQILLPRGYKGKMPCSTPLLGVYEISTQKNDPGAGQAADEKV